RRRPAAGVPEQPGPLPKPGRPRLQLRGRRRGLRSGRHDLRDRRLHATRDRVGTTAGARTEAVEPAGAPPARRAGAARRARACTRRGPGPTAATPARAVRSPALPVGPAARARPQALAGPRAVYVELL